MNVILGIGVVFELPVLIFFLTLLRIASPRFLFAHSRYAVLAIVVLAALITPTPDIVNLMLFSVADGAAVFRRRFRELSTGFKPRKQTLPMANVLIAVLIPILLIAAGRIRGYY